MNVSPIFIDIIEMTLSGRNIFFYFLLEYSKVKIVQNMEIKSKLCTNHHMYVLCFITFICE